MTAPKQNRRSGRTKEVREAEFIAAVEQLLGFPIMAWQRPKLLEIRRASLAGEPIDFELLKRKQP